MKLLDGVRVLDLTNVLAGPFATLHLALLGAEVIKIENPEGGDLARKLGNVPELNEQLMGTSFLAQNANKKSLTLNLKPTPRAKAIFRALVEDGRRRGRELPPGRDGRGWASATTRSPRSTRGWSTAPSPASARPAPTRSKPAYDQIIQGLSGVMAVNGDERLNPLRCGFPVCDTVGGLNARVRHHGRALPPRAHRARASSSTSRCSTRSCR